LNEFDLLRKIRERVARPDDRVLVAAGDDAAVVRPAGSVSVTSVDIFVEGVHFRLVTTPGHGTQLEVAIEHALDHRRHR